MKRVISTLNESRAMQECTKPQIATSKKLIIAGEIASVEARWPKGIKPLAKTMIATSPITPKK